MGLEYLTLSRAAGTLSGGEAQRIRLATQIGSSLVGVLYILDEPSIGLHQKDNEKLLKTLRDLTDLGNTLVVVEHDGETMFAAVKDGKIIGMASLLKTDYYPLPEIFPWVSCVFVEKEFRGDRISGKLIDAANRYAKEQGFTKTYIPTEYTGLYERYGYTYVKDIVNYGGGTDRLYVKEL